MNVTSPFDDLYAERNARLEDEIEARASKIWSDPVDLRAALENADVKVSLKTAQWLSLAYTRPARSPVTIYERLAASLIADLEPVITQTAEADMEAEAEAAAEDAYNAREDYQ